MDYRSAEHRYESDPAFKRLVDLMFHHIIQMDYTPSEMRDAAMLASIKFEMMRPPSVTLPAGGRITATALRKMKEAGAN